MCVTVFELFNTNNFDKTPKIQVFKNVVYLKSVIKLH